MDTKTISVIIVFFIILIGGMFTFAYLKKAEMIQDQSVSVTTPEPEVAYASITKIEGKHYFIDGVHTIVGEIPMPTPCDLLEVDALVAESMPEQITLNFNVINNATFCAEKITLQRFKVSATASAGASFKALFMGRDVELNLIPAAPGEVPEDFEVFIKG
jgi:hypothetical protein